MIKVRKPAKAPNVLLTKGKKKTKTQRTAYSKSPQDYDTGKKTFKHDSNIYGHETVKEALIVAQHGKCCFCESKIRHIAYGDVEHFRPKSGYRQKPQDKLGRPGYYWLAYDWQNLLLSCQICNQRHKGNLFPLVVPSKRARSHTDDLSQEDPLFVDPSSNPEKHISFRQEIPFAKNGSKKGRATIEALGLGRLLLNERRRERYELLKMLHALASLNPPSRESAQAKELLDKAILDSAEYASMVRAAVASGFSPHA